MNTILGVLKQGIRKGFDTIFELSKIILPTYIVVTILKYTPVMGFIATAFEPLMKLFGLPGDAALVLVMGNLINIYASIGIITAMTLTAKQVTILAVMISFSHTLIIETAVIKKIGVSAALIVAIRIGIGLVAGLLTNLLL
jgi:spore maturation protein SpmB